MSLRKKRILVTGAAGGIGAAIATSLVEAGAIVALTDIDGQGLEAARQRTGAAAAIPGDITDETAVSGIFAAVSERLGGVDGLVNNAGTAEKLGGTRRQALSDWRKVIDVNLQGPFLAAREAARHIHGGGAIVNIASVAGLCAFPASNSYSVSKAGIVMMTKTLALDLTRYGIRVNAVAPGVIDAPMARTILGEAEEGFTPMIQRIPMGRLGRAEEIAHAVRFLLSDEASYITGAILPVDGGWSAFGGAGSANLAGGDHPFEPAF